MNNKKTKNNVYTYLSILYIIWKFCNKFYKSLFTPCHQHHFFYIQFLLYSTFHLLQPLPSQFNLSSPPPIVFSFYSFLNFLHLKFYCSKIFSIIVFFKFSAFHLLQPFLFHLNFLLNFFLLHFHLSLSHSFQVVHDQNG